MDKNYFLSGAWNTTCDVCSKKIKASDAKQRWDGFIVCPDDYEMRHSQDFVRAHQDKISVPFQRPIPPTITTSITYINQYVDSGYLEDYSYYITDPDL